MDRVDCRRSVAGTFFRCAYIAVSFVAFLWLARLVREGKTEQFDHRVTKAVQGIGGSRFRRLMEIVSWPGFPPQSRILPFVYPALLWLGGHPKQAKYQMAAWGTAILSGITKFIMRRERPNDESIAVGKGNVTGSSFPSGHVLNYVGVYGFLAYLAHLHIAGKWLRRFVVGGLTSLVALVGPSRIYLGHHWFSDVLASYLLGTGYLAGLTGLYKRSLCRDQPEANT